MTNSDSRQPAEPRETPPPGEPRVLMHLLAADSALNRTDRSARGRTSPKTEHGPCPGTDPAG